MDGIKRQQESALRLQRSTVPLMLQATCTSPPSPSATPLSSPEQSDTEETPIPELPACELHNAITQLLQRLKALDVHCTQRQHKFKGDRQQLLTSGMKTLRNWMDESQKKISDQPAVHDPRKLQEQLENLTVGCH